MTAPMRPPRSNLSVSPMPRRPVKMNQPTNAPARPSRTVAKKPIGSRPGMSRRPRNPATMPRMMAPIMGSPFRGGWGGSAARNYPVQVRRSRAADTVPAPVSLDDPVIITCAISGALANRDQCPAIPYTPEEYAAEARRIVDEGGVHIHVHARRRDGTPSHAVEDFRAIRDAIAGEVGAAAIVNFSTGTVGVSVAKRVAYLRACRPDVAALNMGSM